jgi:uncharacterized protein
MNLEHRLDEVEVRVLGALIEKEITTPEYYPLSLNALMTACNQSSNRTPVVQFTEEMVGSAVDSLREKNLVRLLDRGESRVAKYRHVLYESLEMTRPSIAALCLLMLRGPQTAGEIRTRSTRLYDFTSIEEVDTVLNALISGDKPLVVQMPRKPGQKEARFAHLLSGEIVVTQESELPQEFDRIGRLEKEIEDLKRQFEEFRKQFE